MNNTRPVHEQRRIVFVGDSHTYAIQHALKARVREGDPEAYVYSRVRNGTEYGDLSPEAIDSLVASLRPDDLLVSTCGGSQHVILSLIQHQVAFDFMMPGEAGEPRPDVTWIPYRQLKAQMASFVADKEGKKLERLRRAAKCRFVHLQPPPPKPDSEQLRNLAAPGALFRRNGIAERGVSPASLRMKFWKLQVQVLSEIAHDLKFGLVPPPPESLDAGGFLRGDYSATDATHGNAAYGELVIRQMQGYGAAVPSEEASLP
jgi:hypothetical protein